MGKTMQQVFEEAGRRFPFRVRHLVHPWDFGGMSDITEMVNVEAGGRDLNGDPSRIWIDKLGYRHMIAEHEMHFELVSAAPATGICTCKTYDLMARGCACGAIVPYAQRSK